MQQPFWKSRICLSKFTIFPTREMKALRPCSAPSHLLRWKVRRTANIEPPMPKENKPVNSSVAESPIADVFEGRHPSESEKQWAEKTLAPALEKGPERPIGAPTGVNIDEHGHARFTTISGV